ncbi:MAG: PEP-CTERM sorting domain-containing protein [Fimbriimonadaceae bacterium]|nr:PEP-CTERM sorting domain-containing protein [Fimbriimonadaceae bacterium]
MNNIRRISLALITVASVTAANASILTVSGMASGRFQNVTVNYLGNNLAVAAGAQDASYNSSSFLGYCVDITKFNNLPTSYEVTPVNASTTLPNGIRVSKLYNKYAAGATGNQAAALQLAIWDVLYDNGDGLSSGTFKSGVSGSILSNYNTIIADSLTGISDLATHFDPTNHGTKGDKNQGLIGPATFLPPAPVPEPSSMAVLGLGALAFRRRRSKKA